MKASHMPRFVPRHLHAAWILLLLATPAVGQEPTDDAAPAATPAAEQAEAGQAAAEQPAAQPLAAEKPAAAAAEPQQDKALRAAVAQAAGAPVAEKSADVQLRFNFSGQPWGDVLQWLSEEADLQLQLDQPPPGTLSFIDPTRSYSPNEAIDLINRMLLDKGYALVRRGRLLIVVDLESELAPKLIRELAESVTADQLDQRSGSDIVRCILPLGGVSPTTAQEELSQLIGPWGSVIVLESSRQAIVVETVDKLKAIREALRQANGPGGIAGDVVAIALNHRTPDEVLAVARQLMGLGDENSAEGIQIATDLFGANLFAAGEPSKLSQFRAIVELVDKPMSIDGQEAVEPPAPPSLQRYPLSTVATDTAFNVLSTLLAGLPEVRMSVEPNTGSIILWARPDEQKLVKDTIEMLEGKGTGFEVIQLNRLDPQSAVLTINKFFAGGGDGAGKGPTVDGDPVSSKLWVKGTPDQIQTVRELIQQMEGSTEAGLLDDRVRLLPFSGRSAENTLEQLELIWQATGRKNKIRFSTPSKSEKAAVPERRIERHDTPGQDSEDSDSRDFDDSVDRDGPLTGHNTRRTIFTQITRAGESDANENEKSDDSAGAEIVISLTPGGMIIASDDVQALDQFEELFRALADQSAGASDTPTVFWLKYSKAEEASALLNNILSGTGGSGGGGGLTDMAGSMLGELGGGMLGGLLGLGGGGGGGDDSGPIFTTSGTVSIVADPRLNALIVQANGSDLQLVEDLLSVIDREQSPEAVQTTGKTYLIPVQYQDVNDIVNVCKSVFSDQMEQAAGGGGGGRQPSPQDIVNALRSAGGGRGGRGGGGGGGGQEPTEMKMSLAVDAKNNIVILKGTPQHYQQVSELISSLDIRGPNSEERVEVVSIGGGVNPKIVQEALTKVLGAQATTGSTTSGTSTTTSSSSSGSSSSSSASDEAATAARRAAIFEQLRSRGAFGGGGGRGGRGGGETGGRGGGGGGGRGGRGGR